MALPDREDDRVGDNDRLLKLAERDTDVVAALRVCEIVRLLTLADRVTVTVAAVGLTERVRLLGLTVRVRERVSERLNDDVPLLRLTV